MQLVEKRVCSTLMGIIHLLRKCIAGTETRIMTMKRHCLLSFWPCFTQLPSLYRPDPARCWNSPLWSGPTHIHQQSRKCARDKAIGQSGGGNFSTEVFSSQVTLVCVNLKKVTRKVCNYNVHFSEGAFLPCSSCSRCPYIENCSSISIVYYVRSVGWLLA